MWGGFTAVELATLALAGIAAVAGIAALFKKPPKQNTAEFERRMAEELRQTRQELNDAVARAANNTAVTQGEVQRQMAERQEVALRQFSEQLALRQGALQKTVSDQMSALDGRLRGMTMQNEQKLENIRQSVEKQLTAIQSGNEKKLDEMRHTVDEKLQSTLNERLRQSFGLVNERLEQVYKGLGEMQNLAVGVGDLKKVLSNVKTRGILGEIQLGAILGEILAPEQYGTNVATVAGSTERVEFAVRMPGDGEQACVWLPIDAKFPADVYANLLDAYDTGDAAAVETAGRLLEANIRASAKAIHDKYIRPPDTTDFGILFLPVEGLYAEVVRRGLVDRLQRDYKINIAGPTTMAALLNSLQMGFRTLAIQKRSGEVWGVLGEVKTEFEKFADVLAKARKNIALADKNLEDLIGTRSNQIRRKLRDVTTLPHEAAALEDAEAASTVLASPPGEEDELLDEELALEGE